VSPDELADIPTGSFRFLDCSDAADLSIRKKRLGRPCVIHISKPFRMSKVPVGREFWFEIMESKPWGKHLTEAPHCRITDDDKCPAIGVTWYECIEFCRRLSQKWGRKIALPTEAQWVHACKAGSSTIFPWGSDAIDDVAQNAAKGHAHFMEPLQKIAELRPAGELLPNGWGLYDMVGLVSEWVRDSYDVDDHNRIDNAYLEAEMTDPLFQGGVWRVLKGGAWCLGLNSACDLARPSRLPETEEFLNGFRFIEEL